MEKEELVIQLKETLDQLLNVQSLIRMLPNSLSVDTSANVTEYFDELEYHTKQILVELNEKR